jgi:hypothetical protein
MKIYKYVIQIKDRFKLILPERSKILSVQLQNDIPTLWAAITDHSTIPYHFAIYGTGHEMDDKLYHKFISTLQIGCFVAHIFQIESVDTKCELNEAGYF